MHYKHSDVWFIHFQMSESRVSNLVTQKDLQGVHVHGHNLGIHSTIHTYKYKITHAVCVDRGFINLRCFLERSPLWGELGEMFKQCFILISHALSYFTIVESLNNNNMLWMSFFSSLLLRPRWWYAYFREDLLNEGYFLRNSSTPWAFKSFPA